MMPKARLLLVALFVTLHGINAFVGDFPGLREQIQMIRDTTDEDYRLRFSLKDKMPTLDHLLASWRSEMAAAVSINCGLDLQALVDEANKLPRNQSTPFVQSLLQVLDSSGKPGPGILLGHRFFYGFSKQCRDVSYQFSDRKFEGQYFSVDFVPSLYAASDATCKNVMSIDLCLPRSCSGDEVYRVLVGSLNWTATCAVLPLDRLNGHPVPGTWIIVAVMCTCFFLGITASIYDYFILPSHKNLPYTKTLPMKMWRAFSLYTNIVEIFNTKNCNKPGNIGPLHCMRFFSMCWVVLGHSISIFMAASANPKDVIDIVHDYSTQIVTSAFFAVDTFFWQSGLLLSYIWIKKYNQNKRASMSPLAWVMFYVHRIVRLSPPYYILIAFYTFLFTKNWLNDMPVYIHMKASEPCYKNWWIDYLYLNNFIHYDEQCYLVSWYLSTDLQMYLFAPLILIPFTFGPLIGIVCALIIFAVSTGVNIWSVLHFYFPPTDYAYAKMDNRMTVPYSRYTIMMYNAPWIRCQIYIVGMLTGYFLQMKKKLRIPWYVQIFGWLITIALFAGCIFPLRNWMIYDGPGNGMEIGYSALYSASSKVAWGLALSWITITCYYGYGSFINSFMSWSIWVPLGRLTYSTYLVHICVVIYLNGINQQGLVFGNFTQMLTQFVFPCILIAYIIAILWSSTFEFAFGKLEDALIGSLLRGGGGGRPPPTKPVDPEAPKTEASVPLADSIRKRNGNGAAVAPEPQVVPANDVNVIGTIRIRKFDDDKNWD